jgi:GWxTD domain-containing protein
MSANSTAVKRFLALTFTAALGLSTAQQSETNARPLTDAQRARKEARFKKELQSAWKRWLNEDVPWIITDEEKAAFNGLGTDEEREHFVEQFWLRRDPTPDTIENEYKEEHYRRIAYANERFASGIPGWKTDRGRTYIRFGPPDEIEPHPSGGTYQRSPDEGGGTTSVYPFESWRYRHLDNVGDNVVLEFVDKSMSGEYRLAFDPCEKDALALVPGAAPTDAERLGMSTQAARFQNTNGTTCGPPLGGTTSESFNPFTRLDLLAKVERPPAVKFKDLEAVEATSSRISFNALPMLLQVDYLRITDFSVMTNVTLQFENRNLSFQLKDGLQKSVINVFGRVYTMTRRPVTTFEKPIEISAPADLLAQYAQQRSVFQESLPLAPGKYKLHIVAKDTVSGSMSIHEVALDVPHYEDDALAASSLILADTIQKLPTKKIGTDMFAIGDFKVRPRIDGQFSRDEKLGMYMQVYNPSGMIHYQIEKAGTGQPVLDFSEELKATRQVTISQFVPLRNFEPGDYSLTLKMSSRDRTLQRQANFTVR